MTQLLICTSLKTVKIKIKFSFFLLFFLSIFSNSLSSQTTLMTQGFNSTAIPAGWSSVIVTTGTTSPALSFLSGGTLPTCSPFEGANMVEFNSYDATNGSQIRLYQNTGFSTSGYSSIIVNFSWYEDLGFSTKTSEGVTVQWSTNGTTWNTSTFFLRYNAVTGWKNKSVVLPVGAENQATLYVAFLFTSNYGNNCHLDNVTVTVPCVASITSTTPGYVCTSGTVNLGATSSTGTINWYEASTGGSSLGTGNSFITPTLSSSTTYYVDANNGTCTSSPRIAVLASVIPIPTITGTVPGARCGTGTVSLSATASAGAINWYAAATGGSSLGSGTIFTTPSLSSNTTYYIDATNGGCTTASRTSVTATVNLIPGITSTTPASRCNTGTLLLEATASAGTINWYAASTGGSSLGTGTSFITPSIGATTTYYAEATLSGCTSARSAVVATVNYSITITAQPVNFAFCTGYTNPSFIVATTGTGISYHWQEYTSSWADVTNGGVYSGATGTTLTITNPPIGMNGYKYRCIINGTCTIADTTNGNATLAVNISPSNPATPTSNSPQCGNVTISANPPTATWYWQGTTASGTSTANPATINYLASANGTYYIRAYDGMCWSTGSANTAIVINTFSTAPTSINATSSSICEGNSTTLTFTGGSLGTAATWKWYSGSCGGTLVGTGVSITVSPTINTDYFVRAEGTCNTTACATKTITIIGTNPNIILQPSNQTVCGTTFNIGLVATGATSYQWQYTNGSWSNVVNGTPAGSTYTTPTDDTLGIAAITSPGNYQYKCIVTSGSCSVTSNTATISYAPSASAIPASGAATSVQCLQFTANWGASANATSYYLDVAYDAGFTSMVSGYNNLNVGNVITYNAMGLTTATTYFYRVRSINICGTSANSATQTVATPSGAACYCTSNATSTSDEDILNVTLVHLLIHQPALQPVVQDLFLMNTVILLLYLLLRFILEQQFLSVFRWVLAEVIMPVQ